MKVIGRKKKDSPKGTTRNTKEKLTKEKMVKRIDRK
jgi:hypothetical protein